MLSTVCRLHYRPSRLRQKRKRKKKIAAIQRTGLYFERGQPNENLGLGSPLGQLAGGNEMKQSGNKEEKKGEEKKKNRMAE